MDTAVTSSADAAYSLASSVELFDTADLTDDLRLRFDAAAGDVVISRIGARSNSVVVDQDTAELIRRFADPATIVQAVLSYSALSSMDPRVVLESAYPVLQRLISRGFLVMGNVFERAGLGASIEAGSRLNGIQIEQLIQASDDVDVYQGSVGDGVRLAVKVARPHSSPQVGERISHEAAVLRRLASHTGQTMEAGSFEGRPFVAHGWHDGIDAGAAARRLRADAGECARHELRSLCAAIIEAYADLHQHGVVHGDVHPGNLIVGPTGEVAIIDFGYARLIDGTHSSQTRAGVSFYFEPEYASAHGAGEADVLATAAGEQYAVAALIYKLLTGQYYLDFRLDDRMWQQISFDPPLSFASRSAAAWPAGEGALLRALAKEPRLRHSDMRSFANEFRRACGHGPVRNPSTGALHAIRSFVDELVPRLLVDPRCTAATNAQPTIYSGSPGVAYAMYRLACIKESGALLAGADAWIDHALSSIAKHNAAVGDSFYQGELGVRAVRALISSAQCDTAGFEQAVAEFCSAASRSVGYDSVDVIDGRAGVLIGASLLMKATPAEAKRERAALHTLGDGLARSIGVELSAQSPCSESGPAWLGVAHGWAGLLYAALLWNESTGSAVTAALRGRLVELEALANRTATGLFWDQQSSSDVRRRPQPGWCHGSAGHALLWVAASRITGDTQHLDTAERAARYAFEQSVRTGPSLCCGLTGQSYACLSIFRRSGADVWARRARRLAELAVGRSGQPRTDLALYTGVAGVALLCADVTEPERSHMPLFEADGW